MIWRTIINNNKETKKQYTKYRKERVKFNKMINVNLSYEFSNNELIDDYSINKKSSQHSVRTPLAIDSRIILIKSEFKDRTGNLKTNHRIESEVDLKYETDHDTFIDRINRFGDIVHLLCGGSEMTMAVRSLNLVIKNTINTDAFEELNLHRHGAEFNDFSPYIIKPRSLNRHDLYKISLNSCVVTPKVDGEIMAVIYGGDECSILLFAINYGINAVVELNEFGPLLHNIEPSGIKAFFVVGEYMANVNQLLIFDVIILNGVSFYHQLILNSHKEIPNAVTVLNNLTKSVKNFTTIITEKPFFLLSDSLNTKRSIDKFTLTTDGHIIYNEKEFYYNSTIYKVKPQDKCTVDLFVCKDPSDDNNIWFCLTVPHKFINNYTWTQHQKLKLLSHLYFNTGTIDLLQIQLINSSPKHYSIAFGFRAISDCVFKDGAILTEIRSSKKFGAVVECYFDFKNDKWSLIKLRPDKLMANSPENIFSNLSLAKNPLKLEEVLNPGVTFYKHDERPEYADFNRIASNEIREYIKYGVSVWVRQNNGKQIRTFIDLMGGRSGRIKSFSDFKVLNEIFIVDISKLSINEYQMRFSNFKGNFKSKNTIISFYDADMGNSTDTDKLLKSFRVSESFNNFQIDVVIVIYSIHYMFQSLNSIDTFIKALNEMTHPGSIMITNIIDADLGVTNSSSKFFIKPDKNIQNKNEVVGNFGRVSIPFGSGVQPESIIEPLIYKDSFINKLNKNNWQLINIKQMTDSKKLLTNKNDIKWLSAHFMFVFKRI